MSDSETMERLNSHVLIEVNPLVEPPSTAAAMRKTLSAKAEHYFDAGFHAAGKSASHFCIPLHNIHFFLLLFLFLPSSFFFALSVSFATPLQWKAL